MSQGEGLTLQLSKDKRNFPESLEREEVKPRQSKQQEVEKKKYTKNGIAEFMVVIILTYTLGGGSGEKGEDQLGN